MDLLKRLRNILKIDKKIKKPKKNKFPCDDCIILAKGECREICDKVEMDNKKVKELFLKYNCCIDCGSQEMIEGPCGGAAQNIKCAKCGHRFNMGLPLFIERI